MPELPEVETVVRRLTEYLPGRRLTRLEVRRAASWQGEAEAILNRPIERLRRRAKLIRFSFVGTKTELIVHLKMSGQLVLVRPDHSRLGGGHPTADWVRALPSTHTRVIFTLDDGSHLYFNDMRVFGWCRVFSQTAVKQLLATLGPDVTSPHVTAEWFWKALQRRRVPIKQLIMESHFLAGIGNIYACEGLHLARLNPWRVAASLSRVEAGRLLRALRTVIAQGIELGGTTIADYRDADGLMGGYQHVRRVYMRLGEPCPRCDTPIARAKLAGRGTYYCPHCQGPRPEMVSPFMAK